METINNVSLILSFRAKNWFHRNLRTGFYLSIVFLLSLPHSSATFISFSSKFLRTSVVSFHVTFEFLHSFLFWVSLWKRNSLTKNFISFLIVFFFFVWKKLNPFHHNYRKILPIFFHSFPKYCEEVSQMSSYRAIAYYVFYKWRYIFSDFFEVSYLECNQNLPKNRFPHLLRFRSPFMRWPTVNLIGNKRCYE